jgi:hypothetical protein
MSHAPFFKNPQTEQVWEWTEKLAKVALQRGLLPYTPDDWEEPKQASGLAVPEFEEVTLDVFDYDKVGRKKLFDHCKETYGHTLEWTSKAKMVAEYVEVTKDK